MIANTRMASVTLATRLSTDGRTIDTLFLLPQRLRAVSRGRGVAGRAPGWSGPNRVNNNEASYWDIGTE